VTHPRLEGRASRLLKLSKLWISGSARRFVSLCQERAIGTSCAGCSSKPCNGQAGHRRTNCAVTVEFGGELQTNDRDFARFPVFVGKIPSYPSYRAMHIHLSISPHPLREGLASSSRSVRRAQGRADRRHTLINGAPSSPTLGRTPMSNFLLAMSCGPARLERMRSIAAGDRYLPRPGQLVGYRYHCPGPPWQKGPHLGQ